MSYQVQVKYWMPLPVLIPFLIKQVFLTVRTIRPLQQHRILRLQPSSLAGIIVILTFQLTPKVLLCLECLLFVEPSPRAL